MEILIVDSSIQIIERLEEILSESDNINAIHKAVCYEEASKLFKENEPDFVLLDVSLPGKESFKILKEIKEISRKTFVIILSSDLDKYIKEECTSLGSDFFFDKYYDFEKICGVINTIGQREENASHY